MTLSAFSKGMVAFACVVTLCSCGADRESVRNEEEQMEVRTHQAAPAELRTDELLIPDPAFPVPKATVTEQLADPVPKKLPRPEVKVRGIYVNEYARRGSRWQDTMRLIAETDLNAVVLDVQKPPYSTTYMTSEPQQDQQLKQFIQTVKGNGIFTIGRIVVFKDAELAEANADLALRAKDGGVWRDRKGIAWVDPFKPAVWDYNIRLAKEAALNGFDEIQFDYVRFPENPKTVDSEVAFDNVSQLTKAEAISSFLKKANAELCPLGVAISADVFGLTTSSNNDMGIGQQWEQLSPYIDYISPMVYPSHYSTGMYNIASPNDAPYRLVRSALTDALNKNKSLLQQGKPAAAIRPWLQDFSAAWIKPKRTYTAADVNEQVKAARELGIDQFLLWNPGSIYTYR